MKRITYWPSADLLLSIETSVKTLVLLLREKPPRRIWKAFEIVDDRIQGFHVIERVNKLVSRAQGLLDRTGDSALRRLAREREREGQRTSEMSRFFRDLHNLKVDLRSASQVKWEQHSAVLERLSRTHTVELAYRSSAPLRDRCYARVLELIVEDQQREPLRRQSEPLLSWVARLGNPKFKDLLAHCDTAAVLATIERRQIDEGGLERKRRAQRERSRRHRQKISRSKSVAPHGGA